MSCEPREALGRECGTPVTVRQSNVACGAEKGSLAGRLQKQIGYIQRECGDVTVCIETRGDREGYMDTFERGSTKRAAHLREEAEKKVAEPAQTLYCLSVPCGGSCDGGCGIARIRQSFAESSEGGAGPLDADAAARGAWRDRMVGRGMASAGAPLEETDALARCSACLLRRLWLVVQGAYISALYGENRARTSGAMGPLSFEEPAARRGAGCENEKCGSVSTVTGVCLECGSAGAQAVQHAPIAVARCAMCLTVVSREFMAPAAGGRDTCAHARPWHVPAPQPGAERAAAGHAVCYSCARLHGAGRAECAGCMQEIEVCASDEWVRRVRRGRREGALLQPSLSERRDHAGRQWLVLHVQVLAHDIKEANAAVERRLEPYREGGALFRGPLKDADGRVVVASMWFYKPEDSHKAQVNSKVINICSDPQRNLPAIEIKLRNQLRLGVSSGQWEAPQRAAGGSGKHEHKTQPHCPLENFASVTAAVSGVIAVLTGVELEWVHTVDNLHTILQDTLGPGQAGAGLRAIERAVQADPSWFAVPQRADTDGGPPKQETLNVKREHRGSHATGANIKIALSQAEGGSLINALITFTGRRPKSDVFNCLWEVQSLVRRACGAPAVPAEQRQSDCVAAERRRVVRAASAGIRRTGSAARSLGSGAELLEQLRFATAEEFPTDTAALAKHFAEHPGGADTWYEEKHNQKQCPCCSEYCTPTLEADSRSKKKKPPRMADSHYCDACWGSDAHCVQALPTEQKQPKYFRAVNPGKNNPASRRADPEQTHMKENAFRTGELPVRLTDWMACKIGPDTTEEEVATIAAKMGFLYGPSPGRGPQRFELVAKVCTKCYQKTLNRTSCAQTAAQTKLSDEVLASYGECMAVFSITEIGQPELDHAKAEGVEKPGGEPTLQSKKKRIERATRVTTPYITLEECGEHRTAMITDPGLRPMLGLLHIDWLTDDSGMLDFVERDAARLKQQVAELERGVVEWVGELCRQDRERDARVAQVMRERSIERSDAVTPEAPRFAPAAGGSLASRVEQLDAWCASHVARAARRAALAGLKPLPAARGREQQQARGRAAAARVDAYELTLAQIAGGVTPPPGVATPHSVCHFRRWLCEPKQLTAWVETSKLLRRHGTTLRNSNGLIAPPELGTIHRTLQEYNRARPNALINQCFRQLAQSKEKVDACGMSKVSAILERAHPVWDVLRAEERAKVSPLPADSNLWTAQPRRTTWPVSSELEAMAPLAVAVAVCLGCPGADLEDALHLPLRSDEAGHIFPVQLLPVLPAEQTQHDRPLTQLSVLSEAVMRVFVGAETALHRAVDSLMNIICDALRSVPLQRRRSEQLATAELSEAGAFALLQASSRQTELAHFERANELRTTMWDGESFFRQSRYRTLEPIAVHVARYMLDCVTYEMHRRRTVFADTMRPRAAVGGGGGAARAYGSQGALAASVASMLSAQAEERRCHIYQQLGAQDEPRGARLPGLLFGEVLRSVGEQIGAADGAAALAFLRAAPRGAAAGRDEAAGEAAGGAAGGAAGAEAAGGCARKPKRARRR